MKSNNNSLFILFFILVTLPSCFATIADSTHRKFVTLRAGTVLSLELIDSISSEKAIVGAVVQFRVYKARSVDGDIIFSEKCYGEGRISRIERPKSFGRAGLIEIVPFNVETADREQIAVEGNKIIVKGNERKAFAWVMSGALPLLGLASLSPAGAILAPFALMGFLVKGSEAAIEPSTIFSAYVSENTTLQTKGINIKMIN
jgi:hypothetical protein